MKSNVLADILVKRAGAERDGDTLSISSSAEVAVIASLGDTTMTIERVARIEFDEEGMLVVTTSRKDCYAILLEDVRGIRVGVPRSKKAGLV